MCTVIRRTENQCNLTIRYKMAYKVLDVLDCASQYHAGEQPGPHPGVSALLDKISTSLLSNI
jgi:hypothetical protein